MIKIDWVFGFGSYLFQFMGGGRVLIREEFIKNSSYYFCQKRKNNKSEKILKK